MKTSFFAPGAVEIQDDAASFQAAVATATELLVTTGSALPGYVTEVQLALEDLGPYFVVAPGLAIAHAKPSEQVLAPGMALLKLRTPINSGSHNDPVSLVFALCSTDASSHLDMLSEFGELMSRDGVINSLLNASAESVIRQILSSRQVY